MDNRLKKQGPGHVSRSVAFAGFVFILAIWLMAALLAAEVYERSNGTAISGIVHDKELGWRYLANAKTPGHSVNSSGFRDREHTQTKIRGEHRDRHRIIFFGDSYTVGWGIETDLIFTSLFESALNNEVERYEVMNMAITAWATDQQLSLLRIEGLAFKPDSIILMIAPNDIRESYGKGFYQLTGGQLDELDAPALSSWERLAWSLANHSALFSALQQRWPPENGEHGAFKRIYSYYPVTFPLANGGYASDEHLFARRQDPEMLEARRLFTALISAFHQECLDNNIQLIVSVIPTKMEFEILNDPDKQADMAMQPGLVADYVAAFSAEHDIPYLDLFAAFKRDKNPLRLFIASEFHFNEAGHALVGEELTRFFREQQNKAKQNVEQNDSEISP